jgi:hypothetical protein
MKRAESKAGWNQICLLRTQTEKMLAGDQPKNWYVPSGATHAFKIRLPIWLFRVRRQGLSPRTRSLKQNKPSSDRRLEAELLTTGLTNCEKIMCRQRKRQTEIQEHGWDLLKVTLPTFLTV